MNSPKLTSCLIFLCLLLRGYEGVKGSLSGSSSRGDMLGMMNPTKLFVFGDSYVDAGNLPRETVSWKFPYGISFPGHPTGRASDGLVSSDFLAHYFGLRSPVPYEQRNSTEEPLRYGMNFAYGGSGVFETMFKVPNTTLQINNFEQLLSDGVYSAADLSSSAALFSIAGNDYLTFLSGIGTHEELIEFIVRVVRQMTLDLMRIRDLGVRKVVVPALPPLGCLPVVTGAGGFQNCNETFNRAADFHNTLLKQTLTALTKEANDDTFLILDIYTAFLTILENRGVPDFSNFPDPLRPCCMGTEPGYTCGKANEDGENMFYLCPNPLSSFWWDEAHPSHQAWRSVYYLVLRNLTLLKSE